MFALFFFIVECNLIVKNKGENMKKGFIKLIFGLFAFALVLTPVSAKQAVNFPDVAPNYWAAPQIKELSQKNVIVGYPDGTFKPDANVTRAEFASMAIWALGQEHTTVAQPVNFTDIAPGYWAYDMIQRALYFELISCPPKGKAFRPDDYVTHAEAVSVIVNALTTENITVQKAKEVLHKYSDVSKTSNDFLIQAGKAEILDMNVHVPGKPWALNGNTPATRAEIAVLLKNMMLQAQLKPNKKLAEAMRKNTGEGFVIPEAFIQGSVGTIPAGSIVPIQVGEAISSQLSQSGQIYMAKAPQNYVTKEHFILVYEGADLQGRLIDVRPGRLFIRNGVLVLGNDTITTVNDQMVPLKATGSVYKKKNWFIAFLRKVFKGEKLSVLPKGTVYVKLLQPLKVDLTNGWIFQEGEEE